MEKTTLNDYSHGFLLTSILSSDYIDRSGNGPSIDDYGDYTKFNYSRIGDDNDADNSDTYKWRIPAEMDKAKFGQGLLADIKDNKGVFLYGEKDLWYTQSIETKNYIAFFVLNDEQRKDAFPVNGIAGGRSTAANPSRYLKEIRLYSKKDFIHGGIANAKPIKVVHFEYDYSLCPGVPNNINTVTSGTKILDSYGIPTNGKLTLKKIWFTYGNSQKGKSSPYLFDYAVDSNYDYNSAAIDRWGCYKPNGAPTDGTDAYGNINFGNNLDFPYVNQTDPNLNKQAAAWSLTEIKTPAGSSIKVNYEADDYAYIQDKEAGQMFKVVGLSATPAKSAADEQLYNQSVSREYMIVDLKSSKEGGILSTNSNPNSEFESKYIKGLTQIYFRFKIHMDAKGNDEFVPGYADINYSGVCINDETYTYNGQTYYRYAYIRLKLQGISDKKSSTQLINPIAKAGMQMGRMYLPQIVFPGSAPAAGNGNAIRGLVTTIKDARYFLKGVNKALYERHIAQNFDGTASIVRLYNPNGFKKGGGYRVSKITINDSWNSMSGEADAEYGQEYSYTNLVGGKIISSGVASYEPLQGGDENSMRVPIPFAIDKTFAPNDEYFQEEPMGESFFPDALVGYSKVTVKNIPKTGVTAHATGRTEYEFFTSKDYPVVTDRTDLEKQRVKPKLIQSILKFGSTDKLYLSQGYLIKTNDMNGKQKSQKMFAEGAGANDAISGIIYHYKSKNGIKCQELDNKVSVIDKTNTIADKIIGKTTDFYSDSRSSENDTYTAGISLNINSASCTFYAPLIFVWPSFGHERREFKSMGTTKLIQQYGLIDYVEAFENSSTVKTKNLLYDDVSGEVLLTETTNDFDAPVYNFKYPAYWAYEDMGAAFANAGIRFQPSAILNSGQISGLSKTYFRPGDEVGVFDYTAVPAAFTKTWVVENKQSGNNYFLVNAEGNVFIPPTAFFDANTPNHLKILRSGRRNMQSAPMASLLSLKNPVMIGSLLAPAPSGASLNGGKLIATPATSVINSSAVEYDDNWHLLVGDQKGDNSCVCAPTQDFLNLRDAIYYIINTKQWNASPDASHPIYKITRSASGVLTTDIAMNEAVPSLAPLVSSFTWFNGCALPPTGGVNQINLSVTKPAYTQSGLIYEHKLILQFNGVGSSCNNSSCSIELSLKSYSATNPWDNDYGRITMSSTPTVTCQSSSTFNFCFAAPVASRETNLLNFPPLSCTVNIGTSCYEVTHCEDNHSLVQCGKFVGNVINPYVQNIRGNWRVKKSYSYLTDRKQENQASLNMKGNVREDGVYSTFDPFWSYVTLNNKWQPIYLPAGNYDKWIKNNEVDKINEYGNVLQARDVLNRTSASLYGYNHTLPIAAANNAYYNQLAFDGFEDYDFISNECSASLLGTTSTANPTGYIEHFNYYSFKSQRSSNESHTGRYSINVPHGSLSVTHKLTDPSPTGTSDNVPYTIKAKDNYGIFSPFYSYSKLQTFVLSVWAKENYNPHTTATTVILDYPHVGVSVSVNGADVNSATVKKSAIINGWQKLEYEFTVPANVPNSNGTVPFGSITVSLNNTGTYPVFYDDIRIHPLNSSMKSMVYDPYSLRLMAELDDRNFATLYEYDEEGTLVRVKKETEKGIFTIKESRSGLKK
jgi:hypothetical protein